MAWPSPRTMATGTSTTRFTNVSNGSDARSIASTSAPPPAPPPASPPAPDRSSSSLALLLKRRKGSEYAKCDPAPAPVAPRRSAPVPTSPHSGGCSRAPGRHRCTGLRSVRSRGQRACRMTPARAAVSCPARHAARNGARRQRAGVIAARARARDPAPLRFPSTHPGDALCRTQAARARPRAHDEPRISPHALPPLATPRKVRGGRDSRPERRQLEKVHVRRARLISVGGGAASPEKRMRRPF
jgi:hypothetical protein